MTSMATFCNMASSSVIKVPAALQQALPSSYSAWTPFLRRALQHPLSRVPFPFHFYIQGLSSKTFFSPHKPLMPNPRNDVQSAVLVLLSPCNKVLTSSGDSSSSTDHVSHVARINARSSVGHHFHHSSAHHSGTPTIPSSPRFRLFPDLCITLTKRSMLIRHHRGELSFPGGHLNESETAVEAALRETREEIGLDIPESCVIGSLTPIPTLAGYPVTPILAITSTLLNPYPRSLQEVDSLHYLHMSNLLLRSQEVHARLLKRGSRNGKGLSFFPCFFASPSPTKPSGSVVEASMQDVDLTAIQEDGSFFPLLPQNFPGELVWGLTNFITCELIARVGLELQLTAAGESGHSEKVVESERPSEKSSDEILIRESFLQCTNVVARDPAVYPPSSLLP